ncbi:hypothetical protein HDU96_009537 [Phlyctochytrium bullatum]|nr:hypothetical protein HDU96_009537 [Phlyctochytrium bullatum]
MASSYKGKERAGDAVSSYVNADAATDPPPAASSSAQLPAAGLNLGFMTLNLGIGSVFPSTAAASASHASAPLSAPASPALSASSITSYDSDARPGRFPTSPFPQPSSSLMASAVSYNASPRHTRNSTSSSSATAVAFASSSASSRTTTAPYTPSALFFASQHQHPVSVSTATQTTPTSQPSFFQQFLRSPPPPSSSSSFFSPRSSMESERTSSSAGSSDDEDGQREAVMLTEDGRSGSRRTEGDEEEGDALLARRRNKASATADLFRLTPPMVLFIAGFAMPPLLWLVGAFYLMSPVESRKKWGQANAVVAALFIFFLLVMLFGQFSTTAA